MLLQHAAEPPFGFATSYVPYIPYTQILGSEHIFQSCTLTVKLHVRLLMLYDLKPQTDVILCEHILYPTEITTERPYRAWSIASFYAYRAYNDPRLLDAAEHGWTNASTYIVTQEQAAARRHPYNNFTISSSCQGRKSSLRTRATASDINVRYHCRWHVQRGWFASASTAIAE